MSENSLGNALTNTFSETWEGFTRRLQSHNERLVSELMDNWHQLQSVLDSQLAACKKISASEFHPADLNTYRNIRAESSRTLLHEPVEQIQGRKPYRRALMAVETYRQSLESLILSLPVTFAVSGAQASVVIDPRASKGLMRKLVRRRHREYNLPLRTVVATEFRRLSAALAEIESRYFLALALAQGHIRKPWEGTRAAIDAAVLERPVLGEAWAEAIERELHALVRLGEQALSNIQALLKTVTNQVGKSIIAELVWRPGREDRINRLQAAVETVHWEMQARAAETEIQLERSLEACEDEILGHALHGLNGVREELKSLHAEIGGVLEWLHACMSSAQEREFPQPKADVVPAASRMAELESLLRSELERLPRTLEMPAKFSLQPRRRSHLRRLRPMETVQQAFHRRGRLEILNLLEDVETEHRTIVQQIERAREVVAFARETAGSGPESDPRIVQEAIQNVISLLEFYGREQPEWCASADVKLARALASTYTESRLIMGLHRLGVFTYLIRQGLRRALALAGRRGIVEMRWYLRHLFGMLQAAIVKLLIRHRLEIGSLLRRGGSGYKTVPAGGIHGRS